MLNLSNLAWFEDTLALPQHLQISRMRALETQHPMLRATNTGATAIIDARGRVSAQLPFSDCRRVGRDRCRASKA
jgi:apolipoprotein N-acyltransferase